jgi:cytochrome c556
MRFVVVLLIGLFVGAACSLIAVSAMRKETPPSTALMAMLRFHSAGLDQAVKSNRCAATDLTPRLQTMRHLANDLEPAFGETEDDELFAKHSSAFRAALDAALATPPSDCVSAGVALDRISDGCRACHRDFKG